MKKILVLGGTGAMGRYAVPELLRLGFAVANKTLTGIMRAAKSPYNVNAATQAIATIR